MKHPAASRCRMVPAALFLTLLTAAAQAPAPPEDDIRPARGRVEIPLPDSFHWTPWLITAGILAVIAAVILWRKFRRTKHRGQAPLERAMHDLSAIDRERNNITAGTLADQSASVVRQYIAGRFGIAAPKRTTEEFLRSLTSPQAATLAAHRERLQSFLNACDMAKFAGTDFDAAERLKLLETAFDFVRAADSSLPEPPPASAPPTA